ncbi:MAG TPA: sugar phosphate isomerase/epimerase [Acidobacteriaceae bacterium]|nr:sugar phosphate isomerase/epimerase [Acidobacteriaceae bacterium]
MHSRRSFLRKSAALLPSVALASRGAWAAASIPLGVQLYTVRREAEQDLPRVLDQIRRIGYQEVETYSGIYTYSAEALKHMFDGAGLSAPSGHFGYYDLGARLNFAKELGLSWMVCSMISPSLWGSAEGFTTAAKQFNFWGQRARDLGMRFAFHNHDYEFRPQASGQTGYDILINETDPNLVFFEIDCYWAAQAGHDPVQLIQRLGPRVKMLHLKDRKPGFPPSFEMNEASAHFVPVGSGSLDWKGILAAAEGLDVQHYFVEQDQTAVPPLEAIRRSYEYLRSIT